MQLGHLLLLCPRASLGIGFLSAPILPCLPLGIQFAQDQRTPCETFRIVHFCVHFVAAVKSRLASPADFGFPSGGSWVSSVVFVAACLHHPILVDGLPNSCFWRRCDGRQPFLHMMDYACRHATLYYKSTCLGRPCRRVTVHCSSVPATTRLYCSRSWQRTSRRKPALAPAPLFILSQHSMQFVSRPTERAHR
jgi:hypothetical protein